MLGERHVPDAGPVTSTPLSVALLAPRMLPVVQDLGVALVPLGVRPRVITSHRGRYRRSVEEGVPVTRHWRPPETPWALRNFERGFSHLPFTYASLVADAPDLAHAFNATDAVAALRWSERGGGPVVFSCTFHPARETIAAKRLRRAVLERAVYDTNALTVPSQSARDAVWRWFGVEARVVTSAAEYLDLYRELLDERLDP